MIWRCPMRASDSTTDGSVIAMSHGQNSWSPALIDVLSRSTAVATDLALQGTPQRSAPSVPPSPWLVLHSQVRVLVSAAHTTWHRKPGPTAAANFASRVQRGTSSAPARTAYAASYAVRFARIPHAARACSAPSDTLTIGRSR